MKQLRQYIRRIIRENLGGQYKELDNIIAPPPDKDYRISELKKIQIQMENPYSPSQIQDDLDKDFQQLFVDLLEMHGLKEKREDIKLISDSAIKPIKDLKKHFNIKRPQDLADTVNFPLDSYQSEMASAQTKSYPSGHACQSYLIALILSNRYPHLKEPILHLAECVAQARVDRGVHFPSDLVGGTELALYLYKNSSF